MSARLEKHTSLLLPEEVAAHHVAPSPDMTVPTGHVISGDLGLLTVPSFTMAQPVAQTRYVQAGLDAVRRMDGAGVCGWLVDLRGNPGGSYGPMIGAVAPVLGDGLLGSFVRPDGSTGTSWSLKNGVFTESDGSTSTFATVPYRLKHPDAPIAVLTDRYTASAAEATLISFRGRPDTRSFGQPTAGYPTGNASYTLSDGAVLVITVLTEADRTGHVYAPDTPIPPDAAVPPGPSGEHTSDDPVLGPAEAWLHNQPACTS
ncbi:S41 family peptidase [Kitasatospora sp. GP82]|uniref:S41 family peptidase n=1 Tax=Kitasatospora sp. GP82 TaxID=3035089 RepID=UPI0024731023|nr:S41 family peptidase [Kitasatospora sp. GP82]